jgi:mannosyltransferase OCH1-like enzyme
MIPKIIHSCWYGSDPLPPKGKQFIEEWRKLLPDYSFLHWTNKDALDLPCVKQAFLCDKPVNVANLMRWVYLFKFGGIYMDNDIELLKNLDSFLSDDFFAGWQAEPPEINNAIVGCVPHHPIATEIIERYKLLFSGDEFPSHSGPELTTSTIEYLGFKVKKNTEFIQGGIHIYPSEVFYPYSWNEKFSSSCITARTVAIHRWFLGWLDTV